MKTVSCVQRKQSQAKKYLFFFELDTWNDPIIEWKHNEILWPIQIKAHNFWKTGRISKRAPNKIFGILYSFSSYEALDLDGHRDSDRLTDISIKLLGTLIFDVAGYEKESGHHIQTTFQNLQILGIQKLRIAVGGFIDKTSLASKDIYV